MQHRLPDHLRRIASRVAQHEIGHYVIARCMGFRTGDVSIEIIGPADGHRGGATILLPEPIRSIDALRTYLERRVIVLYAGGAAETLPGFGAPPQKVNPQEAVKIIQTRGLGAESDHGKAKELVHLLRDILHADTDAFDEKLCNAQLAELDRKLFTRAVELVDKHAPTIVGLATNLADRVQSANTPITLQAAYLEALPGVIEIAVVAPFEDAAEAGGA